MTVGVYRIINKENGKFYIGSSLRIEHRWAVHRCDLDKKQHHSRHLQRAWTKLGSASFTWGILEVCTPDQRLALEQRYLDNLTPWNPDIGYNHARCVTNCDPSPETRQKMSRNNSGTGNPNYGKKSSALQKQRCSEANTGRVHTEDERLKISARAIGRPAWNKGKKVPEDQILSGERHPMYGKTHSEETKQKMRLAHQKRKEEHTHDQPI